MAKTEKKNIDDVIASLNKRYGQGTLMSLGSNDKAFVKTFSTGSLAIDEALGGGYAVGRIVEMFADSSCGKTSLCLHAVAQIQQSGGKVAYLDTENAMDVTYAKALGVDVDNLIFSQPDSAEATLQILLDLLDTGQFSLIVVDSVASMVPSKVFEADAGDATIGLLARIMSQEMPKVANKALNNNCTVIFINQIRDKVGGYGGGVTTPGGKALPFYASQRLHLFKGQVASEHGEAVANQSWCRVVKNKVAPPLKEAKYTIKYGVGLDKIQELLDYAVEYGIVKKGGSWYSYNDTSLGQGSAAVVKILEDNIELKEEIESKLKKLMKDGQ